MESKRENVLVGLFTLVAAALLVVVVLLLSGTFGKGTVSYRAFFKNAGGEVFHTYSAYGRGLDILIGAYNLLDIAPKGRDEDGLAYTMAWVRHHDRYGGAAVDANATYEQPKTSDSCCD